MVEDLSQFVVRLMGGFWRFRSRMKEQPRKSFFQKLMLKIYYAYLHSYGAYIGHTSSFASEPCFPHNLHGIFIAGSAKVGRNCVIFHQVTIGANAIPSSKGVGCPEIGDNVYVGAGAKIIGRVKIGNNCRIGANCVITQDVPDNAIVVLPFPRVIEREQLMDNRYFRWSPEGPQYFEDGEWKPELDPSVAQALKQSF